VGPNQSGPNGGPPEDESCEEPGSIIESENQILGERIPVTGTPFTLNYRSDRVPGRTASNILDIPLIGASVPAPLGRIELEVLVAGQHFRQTFAAAPNQTFRFTWDGKDAYGRTVHGVQPATVRISYVYPAVYLEPDEIDQSFGGVAGAIITGSEARQEITLTQEWQSNLGHWDAAAEAGLGAWTLDVQNAYDPTGRALHLGDGSRRSMAATVNREISTLPALGGRPYDVAAAPDGSLYVAASFWVNRVARDGTVTRVAGVVSMPGYNGDGIPATQAFLSEAFGLAVGPDGSLYIADFNGGTLGGGNRVRRVGPDGIITTIAGTGQSSGPLGDGGLATAAVIHPRSVALGPDGSLYILDGFARVRRIGLDGIITTVAGTGVPGVSGDGGPATAARINAGGGSAIAVGSDGSLYIAGVSRVRRVGSDGIITTFAGTGLASGPLGDGGPATQARIQSAESVAVGPDGSVYIGEGTYRVRKVSPDGIITTFAGTGTYGFTGDGGPATQARLHEATVVKVGPEGDLYIGDLRIDRVR
jgi:hypothetical protein